MRANEFVNELAEARRNNFGREISNVQGQSLGKKLASGDPNAQQALAQAKAAQKTNVGDMYGKNMDTLGLTTPQQRLAANKAAAAKYGPEMSVDPDEVRNTQQTNAPATPQPAGASAGRNAWDKTKDTANKAGALAAKGWGAANSAYDAIAGAKDKVSQSKVGQALGGWSQRLVGVGNKQAAAQQYWMKNYIGMVNNLIANAKNSDIPFDFSDSIDQYLTKQNIKVDPAQRQTIKNYAQKVQQGGFQRKDIVSLGRTLWTTGMNASKASPSQDTIQPSDTKAVDDTKPADAVNEPATSNAGANAFGQMATQLGKQPASAPVAAEPTNTAGANAFGNMASQLSKQPEPTKAPATKSQVPVGTKFAVPTKSGDKFIAQKTDTGWKVGGTMITDPKQVEKLEMQATQATPQKGARATNVQRGAIKKLNPAAAQVKPVRKLKAPSALAKGTPTNPAKAGKSRIR